MKDFFRRIFSKIRLSSKKTKMIFVGALALVALFFVGRYFYLQNFISDYSRITILVNNREYVRAEEELQPLLIDDAEDPYFLVLVARTYIGRSGEISDLVQKKDYLTKAIKVLNTAESIDSSIAEIYRIKALAYLNLGEFAYAGAFYKKALKLEPKSVVILNDIGNLMLITHNINKAYQNFKDVLDIDAQNEQAQVGLIRIMVMQNKFDQAIGQARVLYSKSVNRDIKIQLAEIIATLHMKLVQYSEAENAFRNLVSLESKSIVGHYGLAEVAFAKNLDLRNPIDSTKEAKSLAERALGINDGYPYTYILLTRIAILTKNKLDFDKYLPLAKDKTNSYVYLNAKEKADLIESISVFELVKADNVKIKLYSAKATTTRPQGSIIKK